jgi:UDP-N-acetylglucosamine 1-carboxyvinyltransferase
MDRIRIRGGKALVGNIPIGGAKNAALPLMAASLLTDETLRLANTPHLADITTLANLLATLGVEIALDGHAEGGHQGRVLALTARKITNTTAEYDLVRKMRASILVLGPLVAREGQAKVSLPGGCAIGARPVGLKGARFVFPFVSVGATENLMMAATLAKGTTVLSNAAREPEIGDLARCLIAMGAKIEGIDTDTLTIHGGTKLSGATHSILPDRIELGTFAMAAAATGGDVELIGGRSELIASAATALTQAGVTIEDTARGLRVRRTNAPLVGVDVMTEPFPGFPTDLQAQMMALLTTAEGASMITETIFENRFMHVPELRRMGANINLHGGSAMVRGVPKLTGAPVMATDLRASVSLVIAGLVAQGETIVNRVYHLDRGYERLEAKLAACGADIERVKDAA